MKIGWQLTEKSAKNMRSWLITFNVTLGIDYLYLICCSFLASSSRAWKSIDNSPTKLFTTSMPERHLRIFFLCCVHFSLVSSGAHRDMRTRQGKMGRSVASGRAAKLSMSTFWIAAKTSGETGVRVAIIQNLCFTCNKALFIKKKR